MSLYGVVSLRSILQHETCVSIIPTAATGLPLPQRLAASAVVGLVNRDAGRPFALGVISANDALWLKDAQQGGGLPSNDTVQKVPTLTNLIAIALRLGAILYSAHHTAYSCPKQLACLQILLAAFSMTAVDCESSSRCRQCEDQGAVLSLRALVPAQCGHTGRHTQSDTSRFWAGRRLV